MSYAITTEPPFGPEEYQQGWREGYEQGRRDAELEHNALLARVDEPEEQPR